MENEKTNSNPPREKLLLFWNSVRRIVTDLDVEDSKRTEDHESRIRRHYSQLLSNLNVPDVVTQMFQSGKLTAKEHEHLRQFHSTPIRASEELLNIIIINSRDVYDCFLESLKKTKQHHVYQMLTSGEETVSTGEQSVSEHFRVIRQNYDWLTEKLDPDSGLLSTLYAKEVLSQREYGQIYFEKEQFVKNEMLLSIMSRKSVEDFKKFKIALIITSQEHIASRLTDTLVGDENQNVTTTVKKTLTTRSSDSLGERIPPKLPPKPKKQPPTSPSSKPMVIKPKPLLKPKIGPSKPNQIEKQQNASKHEKKRSVERLEAKFKGLPNELQTEVSTKLFLIHRRKSTDSIWKITLTKILEESRDIKRQNLMQAKAADENCETLNQEIIQRERECKIIKEDIERERTKFQKQLRELQERLYELEYKRNLAENENINMCAKLKKSEVEVEGLKMLNKQKEQEVNEKVSIIRKLEVPVTYSDIKLKETEAQLRDTTDKLTESEIALKETTRKLEETQERLKEMETKHKEFEAKPIVTEKGTDSFISEDELQDKYKSDPVLVHTIGSKPSAEDEETSLSGMTILDKELFFMNENSSKVEVHDLIKFSFSRRWNLKELIYPMDITSCKRNKCLYIFHSIDGEMSGEILRVDPNGKLISKWSTGDDWGRGLSVTGESNVIVTVFEKNKLNEYSPNGQLIREIKLSSASGIRHPYHAIKLDNGHFVVCHGKNKDDLHRVCVVDANGKLQKSFGGKLGSSIGQMDCPAYLSVDRNGFVMVADCNNGRVLLLNSDLKFNREIISKEKHGLQNPASILLDEFNCRLFVSDSAPYAEGRILIFIVNK